MKTRPYPDHTIEDAARKAGADVVVCWEVHGPKDTAIAWMSRLLINGVLVHVETFFAAGARLAANDKSVNGGWEVFTPTSDDGDIAKTVEAVLARCKPPAPSLIPVPNDPTERMVFEAERSGN